MKKIMKRLSVALSMLVLVMSLTACSTAEAEESTVDSYVVEVLESSCESVMSTLPELSDEDIESFLASGDEFTIAATNAWLDNGDELGGFVEIVSSTVDYDKTEDKYVLHSDVAFELKNATVSMNFDGTGTPTYMTIEVQYSLGELMGQAGLNTIMGIGIVFLVLLFLSFLIGLFKYIGVVVEKMEKKNAPKAAAPVAAPKAAPVAAAPVEELVDDKELVAVIAAAIAAYENTSTDSFVVRSIRRKPNNKWSRA